MIRAPDDGATYLRRAVAIVALAMLFAACPALAHESSDTSGLIAGLEHPLTGPDHLLAMVSVGIWGAVLGRPLLVALPVVFPTMMAVGGLLGIIGAPVPPVEIGIAVSVLSLGGALALSWRAPNWAAILLVALFALFHGYAHGRELPRAADPVYYSLGFMLSTGTLHVVGIGIGTLHEYGQGRLTRAIGGLVALAGGYFLWQAVH